MVKNCGKEAYKSETEAKRVRRSVGKKRTTRLRVYKCPSCGYWHLTSVTNCEPTRNFFKMKKHQDYEDEI